MLEIKQYPLSRAVQKSAQTSDQPSTMFLTIAGQMLEDFFNSRQSVIGSRTGEEFLTHPSYLIVNNDISNFTEIEQASVHVVA